MRLGLHSPRRLNRAYNTVINIAHILFNFTHRNALFAASAAHFSAKTFALVSAETFALESFFIGKMPEFMCSKIQDLRNSDPR
jgi:hypothetical protein